MLTTENTVLVVVDVQEKLFSVIDKKEELAKNLSILIQGAQVLGIPALYTEQVPEKLGKTIPRLAAFLSSIAPIAKKSFSCCKEMQFIQRLDALSRKAVVLAGIESHVCVYQTARDLVNLGYDVCGPAEAVSSRTKENKLVGLDCAKESGVSVSSVEAILFELLQVGEGERFKRILALVK